MIEIVLTIVFVIIFFALRMALIEIFAGWWSDRKFWREQKRWEKAWRDIDGHSDHL